MKKHLWPLDQYTVRAGNGPIGDPPGARIRKTMPAVFGALQYLLAADDQPVQGVREAPCPSNGTFR